MLTRGGARRVLKGLKLLMFQYFFQYKYPKMIISRYIQLTRKVKLDIKFYSKNKNASL